jgi:hypothetical protein
MKRPRLPLLASSRDGNDTKLTYLHPDPAMARIAMAAQVGAGDEELVDLIVGQLANVTARGAEVHTGDLNRALTVVQGIEPNDTVEALLATQMAAIHIEMMKAVRRLATAEVVPQHDSALNAVNKLARTFAAQVEALKKHRSCGEQVVRVERVTVHEGGQAVVGIVQPQGGGGAGKIERQSHEPLGRDAASATLPSNIEENQTTLSSPGGIRQEGVPVSRSERRSANGIAQRKLASRSAQ